MSFVRSRLLFLLGGLLSLVMIVLSIVAFFSYSSDTSESIILAATALSFSPVSIWFLKVAIFNKQNKYI